MPKYWVKQTASGFSPEWDKSKRRRKKERLKVSNNNGQLRIATPPQVAHASSQGQKKPHPKKITPPLPPQNAATEYALIFLVAYINQKSSTKLVTSYFIDRSQK